LSTQTLGSPVLNGSALRSVNFFNGRLLTGDDLAAEQSALHKRLEHLGQLTGAGVGYGLEVQETPGTSTPQNPVVTVAGGLAVSPSGTALWLPSPVDLSLAGTEATSDTEPGALFAPCQPFAPGTYTAGAGVYLLWIGPASQSDGLAQVNGLGNQIAPCNVDDYIDTVEFGLIRDEGLIKVYGRCLISSHGDASNALGPKCDRRPFSLDAVFNQPFEIDHFQDVLFVTESFDQLFKAVEEAGRRIGVLR